MTSSLGGERLAALRAAKLAALARRLGDPADLSRLEGASALAYPNGAGLVSGGDGWLLEEALGARSAGRIVLWALRHRVDRLRVIVGGTDSDVADDTEVERSLVADVARRLGWFDLDVDVRRLVGTESEPVAPATLSSVDTGSRVADAEVTRYGPLFDAAGVELVVEGDEVRGEVYGLEVARVVDGALEVGVGRFDREITSMLYADLPPEAALTRAADIVRQHRYPGAPPHPMMNMGHERWLRRQIVADPTLIGCSSARPIPTTVPPPNLRDPQPAAALAEGPSGDVAVTVVCGAGLDVDLLPVAADAAAANAGSGLVVVVAEGELLAPLRSMADHLRVPARWVELPAPWAPRPAA